MEQHQHEPRPPATLPIVRHDGWTGEKMAIFCETLAETAIVADACDAARMGISGAYAARRRSPVFAAAWDAALSIARERLADTLLARSMEGNVEQIYKDGELVGERHFLDNRPGLAILRRLDRLADINAPTCARAERSRSAPAPDRQPVDWALAVDALRTGDDEAVAKALAMIKSNEVEEVEGDPIPPLHQREDEGLDLSDRCWWDEREGCWMTDFPPPAGFEGYETRDYSDIGDEECYERGCTGEEAAILDAVQAGERGAERAGDEQLRDEWFAVLRAEVAGDKPCGGHEAPPGSDPGHCFEFTESRASALGEEEIGD